MEEQLCDGAGLHSNSKSDSETNHQVFKVQDDDTQQTFTHSRCRLDARGDPAPVDLAVLGSHKKIRSGAKCCGLGNSIIPKN